jgi:hypothetical protein
MRYEKIMCCNCRECKGKNIIKYNEAGAKVTRCTNFQPNYEYKSVGDSYALFDEYLKKQEGNGII